MMISIRVCEYAANDTQRLGNHKQSSTVGEFYVHYVSDGESLFFICRPLAHTTRLPGVILTRF